ncbi:MAG: VCBS repeat-containing protein, partial [Myxococcota bacterium]
AADVDNDPMNDLELVFADDVFTYRGGTLARLAEGPVGFDHALVAQLDGAGPPEIVSVDFNTHLMDIWRVNPAGGTEFVRRGLDINGTLDPVRCAESSAGRERGGGPPTAGDVNGDGVPDIAIAGGVGYAVLNGASLVDMAVSDADTFLWQNETVDCSSAQTGSSVFDFNGDGRVEVLYADEQTFRIYNGENGDVIFQACNTNGTILEQPIVADVDADGQADAIVVSNARYRNCIEGTPLPDGSPGTATDATSGVRIYSSVGGDWVRTRRVWNQHAYSITNVREDGTIPSRVDPNWQTLNNFRLNRQPGNEDAAADVVVQLLPNCAEGALEIVVRNVGESVLPAGVSIDVYRGPGMTPTEAMRLETLTTTTPLFPAQSQAFSLPLGDDRDVIDLRESAAFAIATVPEGTPECRAENNVSVLARFCDLL